VARGLHYLHRNKIFHRDIKSANILVDGDEGEFFKSVKLCDFNISTYRSDAFSRVGTPRTHHTTAVESSPHHRTSLPIHSLRLRRVHGTGAAQQHGGAANRHRESRQCVVGLAHTRKTELETETIVCRVCRACVVWSFGMFIVELITLDAPYAGLAEGEYARLISHGILPPNLPSVRAVVRVCVCCACVRVRLCVCVCERACQELSIVIIVAWQVKENKGVELVIKCCNLNPALRPSARDVVVYLNPLDDSCNAP
jgi:serine/threonine protein kinase